MLRLSGQNSGGTANTLDRLDQALIVLLQADGRRPLTELGEKLGVSHVTVRNRIDRLMAQGILQITAVVEPERAGFPTQVLIGINADLKYLPDIENQLAGLEEVYHVSMMTGRFDFAVTAAFTSDAHLRDFLQHKLSRVKGIRGTETFHMLHMAKRLWRWRVPVKGKSGAGPLSIRPRNIGKRVSRRSKMRNSAVRSDGVGALRSRVQKKSL